MAVTIFYSYSVVDERYQQELEKHLAVMQRSGVISGWHFKHIEAGDEWRTIIDGRLASASMILLLLSRDFLASEYCTLEMERALQRHSAGEAVAIPIILRACDWKATPLGGLQALPPKAKPIDEWPSRDAAWQSVVEEIRRKVDSMNRSDEVRTIERATATARPRVKAGDVAGVIRRFKAAFPPPFLHDPIDEAQMRRVVQPDKPLPPLFYRWRIHHAPVDWVEFVHFLLLRRVADIGFPIRFLIDDIRHDQEIRQPTDKVIAAIFGSYDAKPHWLRDTYANRDAYARYAEQQGFNADAAQQLANATSDLRAEYWLQFVTWLIKEDGRCIMYAMHPHRSVYETLRRVWSIELALVLRPVYRLGGNTAKAGPPGNSIVVEPPTYPSILGWLDEDAKPADVCDLAKYLTLGEWETRTASDDALDRAAAVLQPYLHLRSRLDTSPDFRRGALALIDAMMQWNERYFTPTATT